jgi:hypothetical protein
MSGDHPDVEVAPHRTGAEPRRIDVAISPDMVRALERVIEHEGVTLAEALRRLVGYGDFVYRAVRERGEQLVVTGADGTREVVLL